MACDVLYLASPVASEYERFGLTCGDRVVGLGYPCASEEAYRPPTAAGATVPDSYGEEATLDRLWDACAAGDALRCDYWYLASPLNSEYEQFGLTCGDRVDGEGFSCFTRNFTSDGDATGGDSGELPPAIV